MSFDTCHKHVALICPWIESVIQRSVTFMLSYTANILVYIRNIHIHTENTSYMILNIRIVTSLLTTLLPILKGHASVW
jgi:hypothetical protein